MRIAGRFAKPTTSSVGLRLLQTYYVVLHLFLSTGAVINS